MQMQMREFMKSECEEILRKQAVLEDKIAMLEKKHKD